MKCINCVFIAHLLQTLRMFVVLLCTLHFSAGVSVVDTSIPAGRPNRRFRCRSCLLFWTGDYPGIAKASGTHDKCCHWCTQKSTWTPEVSRRCWGDFRRFLPLHPTPHEFRNTSARYGPAEMRETHPMRTSEGMTQQGKANVAHERRLRREGARAEGIFKKDLPFKEHGIHEPCPLRHLPFFDVVWDFMPDMMHLNSGVWQRHLFELMKGKRMPAAVRARKKNNAKENTKLLADHELVKAQLADWALDKVHVYFLLHMFLCYWPCLCFSAHVVLFLCMFILYCACFFVIANVNFLLCMFLTFI